MSEGTTRELKPYDLKRLQAATNQAIKTAIRMRRKIEGAVNWSDLHCFQAERWTDADGATGYRVWIEEASPDASEFYLYIAKKLVQLGFQNIEVRTEW